MANRMSATESDKRILPNDWSTKMIGIAIHVRPVAPQLHILKHIMNQTFAESSSAQPPSKSK